MLLHKLLPAAFLLQPIHVRFKQKKGSWWCKIGLGRAYSLLHRNGSIIIDDRRRRRRETQGEGWKLLHLSCFILK